jgi:hypothetical protein
MTRIYIKQNETKAKKILEQVSDRIGLEQYSHRTERLFTTTPHHTATYSKRQGSLSGS